VAGWWPVAQAAVAAMLAWLIAHRALGHSQPFFAPIAAAITLSTSRIQRSRRIAQLIMGVLLGIGIAELLVAILGATTVALGVIVFATMLIALAIGFGFFAEGMMFANQAAAAAILIVTLHRSGTGSERVVDALVGGAVALVIGVLLFPAHPLSLLEEAERDVLRSLARMLERVCEALRTNRPAPHDFALEKGYEIHQLLAALARARSTARANVRVAPRRWRLRAAVNAEIRRTAQLDLLANAVLGLVRAATRPLDRERPLPDGLQERIASLGSTIQRLSATPQPWPPRVLEQARAVATAANTEAMGGGASRAGVLAWIVAATAGDLVRVLDLPPEIAARRPPADLSPLARRFDRV
jgi:uncharacterized membrane protein YgaE (UPF0421/DUF939 family)